MDGIGAWIAGYLDRFVIKQLGGLTDGLTDGTAVPALPSLFCLCPGKREWHVKVTVVGSGT
jgi:hypothetical protein